MASSSSNFRQESILRPFQRTSRVSEIRAVAPLTHFFWRSANVGLPLNRQVLLSPKQRCLKIGWSITPMKYSPFFISPISVPNSGIELIKDLVPSIGSSIQTYSASKFSLPNSSPTIPASGNSLFIMSRKICSVVLSTIVTGEASDLLSTA